MFFEVSINMKHSSALVTVAMLSTYLSEKKSDYMELLTPFVLTLLPKSKGEFIDKNIIIAGLENEYGFDDFPVHLLTKILNKCSKKNHVFKQRRTDTNYYVKNVYDSTQFNKKKKEINNSIGIVIESITIYLKEKTSIKDLRYDNVKNMLLCFFEKFCIDVCRDLKELRNLTNKDYINYHIARFIISENEKSSDVFNSILEIIKGFFVYKAIYYYNTSKKKDLTSKLNGTQVYFDTRLIIHALGYNTSEDKKATRELIQLIRDSGGEVRYFPHIKDEMAGILTKYAYDVSTHATMKLAYFDINNYQKEDVIRLRDSLEINLNKLNIVEGEIPARNLTDDEDSEKKGFIDVTRLKDEFEHNFRNHNSSNGGNRVDNDVSSIEAISLIRGSNRSTNIENCKAIFVTQNYGIIETVNYMFKDRFDKGEISFAIHEIDLTAVLWLRSFNKNSKMPYFKLLENAYAACSPTDELLYTFMKKVDLLEKEGIITDEEALLLRTQRALHDDLVSITENDSKNLTDNAVIQIKERYAYNITKERDEIIKAQNKKLQEYEEVKSRLYDNANKKAVRISEVLSNVLSILIKVIIILLFIVCTASLVIPSINGIINTNSHVKIIIGAIGSMIGIIGLYDSFISRKRIITRLITRSQSFIFDTIYKNEIKKIKKIYL